ncbi:butyrate kinase [bacterium]|nr:butyrate kinase [bacterium]
MGKDYKILAINPGSTSTKIAVFENAKCLCTNSISHSTDEIAKFHNIADQYEYRARLIEELLDKENVDINSIDVVVGRGGLLKPIPSGAYKVNDKMVEELRSAKYGEHASNLGAMIASKIGKDIGVESYIVDPVVVDEMEPIAKISGMPEIQRKSIFHALNQKAVARKAAGKLGKDYSEVNLIVTHLGGGVSVGAHKKGRVIDVNNALCGDGPFSPERSGGLPATQLLDLLLSGQMTEKEIRKRLIGNGGIVAYLGTNDMRKVENDVKNGDEKAILYQEAMAYQIAKEIGSCAAVLNGEVDAIIFTGGLAYDELFIKKLEKKVAWISKILVFPGEEEMESLACGVLRVVRGEEEPREYTG